MSRDGSSSPSRSRRMARSRSPPCWIRARLTYSTRPRFGRYRTCATSRYCRTENPRWSVRRCGSRSASRNDGRPRNDSRHPMNKPSPNIDQRDAPPAPRDAQTAPRDAQTAPRDAPPGQRDAPPAAAKRTAARCLVVHDDLELRLRLAALARRAISTLDADCISGTNFELMTPERLNGYAALLLIVEFHQRDPAVDPLTRLIRARKLAPQLPIFVFARG